MYPVATLRAFLALLLFALFPGCADDPCPGIDVCDIGQRACQERIMRSVSCMRGGHAALPMVSVVSEQQLLERFESDDESTEEERVREAQWTHGLALFELAPKDYDREAALMDSTSEVAAVYFNDTKEIVVVDRGESMRSVSAVEIFAHELTHALQDADHGLYDWKEKWTSDYDSSLAVRAVVEGEAVLYQLLAHLKVKHLSSDDIDWRKYFEQWRTDQLQEAELDDAPVNMAGMRFPYAFGGGYVMQHWLARGRSGIDALWAKPPLTTQEVLFGPNQLATAAEKQALLARGVPALPGSFSTVASSSLGAWITRVFAARKGIATMMRLFASEALLSDLFSVQVEAGSGNVVASWRMLLQDGIQTDALPGLHGQQGLASWTDMQSNELFMLGSDRPLNAPMSLAWGPGMAAGEMNAAARRSGCVVKLPPLEVFDAP